jgi:hypothetical protein
LAVDFLDGWEAPEDRHLNIIHPTTTGFRYCVWVSELTPEVKNIRAIPFRGTGLDVLLGPATRDWLTEADGLEVKRLMGWLERGRNMHPRVHRAYWNYEYALHLYELDMRYPLIVGGFEALISTSGSGVTWQFIDRVSRLATQFNVPLTETDLKNAYELRSRLVHGESFLYALTHADPFMEQPKLYQELENLLRLTVRECLLDPAFHDRFRMALP